MKKILLRTFSNEKDMLFRTSKNGFIYKVTIFVNLRLLKRIADISVIYFLSSQSHPITLKYLKSYKNIFTFQECPGPLHKSMISSLSL